jgi:hypothetical protein
MRHYLWRAVDQHGNVLDILVTSRRDTRAAMRFFRKLLKGLEYVPRVLVTDKLGSYAAAQRQVLRSVEHRQAKYLNNRAKNSPPTDPATRTSHETVHLNPARATVPLRLQRHLPTLPTPPLPTHRRGLPPRDGYPIHHLEPDHRHGHNSSLTQHQGSPQPADLASTTKQAHQVDNASGKPNCTTQALRAWDT